MCISWFKVNLGKKAVMCWIGWLEENCGVQKIDLCWIYCVLNLNGGMMVVEDIEEIGEEGDHASKYQICRLRREGREGVDVDTWPVPLAPTQLCRCQRMMVQNVDPWLSHESGGNVCY